MLDPSASVPSLVWQGAKVAIHVVGPKNLAFMHGPPHKAIRKSFLALFTRKALGTYVELQDGIVRRHITQWLKAEGEREVRPYIRSAQAPTMLIPGSLLHVLSPGERRGGERLIRSMCLAET